MAAVLGEIDALVFSAGVGENSSEVRAAACSTMEFIGLKLDSKRNARPSLDADISYNQLRENPNTEMAPRTFFFAGKAAPAYRPAKLIIKFINNLAARLTVTLLYAAGSRSFSSPSTTFRWPNG
jgi:Acetokinase family/Carbohydrate phosphorylase